MGARRPAGLLQRRVATSWRWMGSHPFKRSVLNWALWASAVLIVIAVAAGGGSTTPSSHLTGATGSTASGTSTSVAHSTTTRSSTGHVAAGSSPLSAAPSIGAEVVNGAGAVLPNPSRTPGAINPQVTQADIHSTICVSGWTSSIRPPSSYTTALKEQQLASGYAYHGDTRTSDYEEDHLISLEIGGSPISPLNLWPEPYNVPDGARVKDQIENRLNILVCDGAITLATAQHAIATNWYAAYLAYIGTPPSSGTTPTTTQAAVSTPRASSLSCAASMSNASPPDYSTTDVIVHTAAGASVTTVAHYKSTNTTHNGAADSSGVATIPYEISRATVGYTVEVGVTVSAAGAAATCSTSFTPS